MTEAINNSLVTGGTKGIGSVITEVLRDRGDRVITISRGKMNDENHVEMDLSSIEDISSLPNRITSGDIHNLVFCHRYRGNNWGEEFQVSLEAVNLVIENVKKKLASVSSIVIIGSNASQYVFEEQSQPTMPAGLHLKVLPDILQFSWDHKAQGVTAFYQGAHLSNQKTWDIFLKITLLENLLKRLDL